jgi:hypothetical protein
MFLAFYCWFSVKWREDAPSASIAPIPEGQFAPPEAVATSERGEAKTTTGFRKEIR